MLFTGLDYRALKMATTSHFNRLFDFRGLGLISRSRLRTLERLWLEVGSCRMTYVLTAVAVPAFLRFSS